MNVKDYRCTRATHTHALHEFLCATGERREYESLYMLEKWYDRWEGLLKLIRSSSWSVCVCAVVLFFSFMFQCFKHWTSEQNKWKTNWKQKNKQTNDRKTSEEKEKKEKRKRVRDVPMRRKELIVISITETDAMTMNEHIDHYLDLRKNREFPLVLMSMAVSEWAWRWWYYSSLASRDEEDSHSVRSEY